MTQKKSCRTNLFFTVTLMISLAGALHVSAAGQSSTNYRIKIEVLDGGGVSGGSSRENLSDSIGQSSAIGPSSSSNHNNHAGFWRPVASLTRITVTITATDPIAAEAGLDPAECTLTRTGDTSAALTVNYTLGGTATNGADYSELPGSVTIPAGSATAAMSVTPVNDGLVEGSETVVVTVSPDATYTVGTPASATVTIVDDDIDTDGDGFSDAEEVAAGSDPLDPFSFPGASRIHLVPGYNQVHIPGDLVELLAPALPTAFEILPLLGDETQIECIQAVFPASGVVRKACYEAGAPSGDDFALSPGQGLIVYSKVTKEVTFTAVLCPAWDLHVGANLMGTPCAPEGLTAFQLLQAIGDETVVSSIQRFNLDTGMFETAAYQNGLPSGVDFPIAAGEGYLVFMKSDLFEFRP